MQMCVFARANECICVCMCVCVCLCLCFVLEGIERLSSIHVWVCLMYKCAFV